MKSIFILTGAGISAESGIQVFRGPDGLWEGHMLEEVASPEAFRRDSSMVCRFYNMRRAKIRDAAPNAAHFALARLERDFPGTVSLVTQNIDDLHERAGSRRVIHMHGEAMKASCLQCEVVSPCEVTLDETHRCPACGTVGTLRPHVVWFGEIPLFLEEIGRALTQADLFIAIGTSGVVYPAAGFAGLAARHGIRTIEVNPVTTDILLTAITLPLAIPSARAQWVVSGTETLSNPAKTLPPHAGADARVIYPSHAKSRPPRWRTA